MPWKEKMPENVYNSLSKENIEAYILGGGRYTWPLCACHRLALTIDIQKREIALAGVDDGTEFDLARMRYCVYSLSASGDFSLAINPVLDWVLYYNFLNLVGERIHSGSNIAQAFNESVTLWERLVQINPTLSQEREVGLFAELCFLNFLAADENFAVEGWTGPESEEHDFKFLDYDIEVKATRSDVRSHRISSVSQLTPSPEKSLYLLSIQLTQSGAAGLTLPELVALTSENYRGDNLTTLKRKLAKVGYTDGDSELYRTKWALRTSPALYAVDNHFPRIQESSLNLEPQMRALISDIQYRVNVSTLTAATDVHQAFVNQNSNESDKA
jgi:hypothetical protein